MSRKSVIKAEEKVEIVERYLNGEVSQKAAANICNVDKRTLRDWIRIYDIEGPIGLSDQAKNRYYSTDLKLQAISDYLNGNGSQDEICNKYGIRHHTQLMNWIKVYNEGRKLKELTGGTSMKQPRVTTQKERLTIVRDCLANDKNYGAIAIKYQCSYHQVWNWVAKYEKMGKEGLQDRRGKRAGSETSRTQEEELRDKIAELKHRNKGLQMENDLLKKVRDLERGNHFH